MTSANLRRAAGKKGAIAGMLIALGSSGAWGGADVSCHDPVIFQDAGVNVLLVPAEGSKGPLSVRAQELTLLMQRHTLFSLLRYGSIGVERLYKAGGEPCNVELVRARLFGAGGRAGAVRAGHGVVIVSGRLYEEAGSIFLQTFVDYGFFRAVDRVDFAVGPPGATQSFVWTAAQRPLIFAPRRLSSDQLARVHESYQRASVLHSQPDDASPGSTLELVPNRPFAYYVIGVRGPWMQVRSIYDGREGWLRGTVGEDTAEVAGLVPELDAIEGAVGYLLARENESVGDGQGHLNIHVDQSRLQSMAREALARYLRQVQDFESRRTLSSVHVLSGTLALPSGVVGSSDASLSGAEIEYRQAVELDAYNSDALQLRALIRLATASHGGALTPDVLMDAYQGLWKAASIAPEDAGILQNLDRLYQLPSARSLRFGLSVEEFRQQSLQLNAAAQPK